MINYSARIPFEDAVSLLSEFQSFRGIAIWAEWVHERIIRMPFVMRTKFLQILEWNFERDQYEALVDWLHFPNPSMVEEEEAKTIKSFAEAQNKSDFDEPPPLIGKILCVYIPRRGVSEMMRFWELLVQRFLVDSGERRFFTIRFGYEDDNIQLKPILTSSERNEELRMLIHRRNVFICRWPTDTGMDFTPMLDRIINESQYRDGNKYKFTLIV